MYCSSYSAEVYAIQVYQSQFEIHVPATSIAKVTRLVKAHYIADELSTYICKAVVGQAERGGLMCCTSN